MIKKKGGVFHAQKIRDLRNKKGNINLIILTFYYHDIFIFRITDNYNYNYNFKIK